LETNGQFHQHFTLAFFELKSFWQLFSGFKPKHSFVIFGAKILYEKCMRKMLMKLTPRREKPAAINVSMISNFV
jgi:hypothetical protein